MKARRKQEKRHPRLKGKVHYRGGRMELRLVPEEKRPPSTNTERTDRRRATAAREGLCRDCKREPVGQTLMHRCDFCQHAENARKIKLRKMAAAKRKPVHRIGTLGKVHRKQELRKGLGERELSHAQELARQQDPVAWIIRRRKRRERW